MAFSEICASTGKAPLPKTAKLDFDFDQTVRDDYNAMGAGGGGVAAPPGCCAALSIEWFHHRKQGGQDFTTYADGDGAKSIMQYTVRVNEPNKKWYDEVDEILKPLGVKSLGKKSDYGKLKNTGILGLNLSDKALKGVLFAWLMGVRFTMMILFNNYGAHAICTDSEGGQPLFFDCNNGQIRFGDYDDFSKWFLEKYLKEVHPADQVWALQYST